MLAGACLERSSLSSAENHIAAAQIAVQDTLYGAQEVHARCDFFHLLIHAVESQQIPTPDEIFHISASIDPSFLLYLTMLSHLEHDTDPVSLSFANQLYKEVYRNYILARLHMQKEEFMQAYRLLQPVCAHPPAYGGHPLCRQ